MSDRDVEFDLNWDKLNDYIDDLAEGKFLPAFIKFANDFGNEIRENLRKHILAQDLNWRRLSARTVRRKGHAFVYIETGFYLKNISVEVDTGSDGDVYLSVRPTGRHPTNRVKLQDVAEILETGAPKIPARPLWRPVKNEMWNYSSLVNFDLSEALR